MDDFLEVLSAIDLTLPPPEILQDLRRSLESRCDPRWIALLHKDPLDGCEYAEPTFTSPSLVTLLSKRSTRNVSTDKSSASKEPPKPLEGPASEISPALAAIVGTEPVEVARFLEEQGTFHVYGRPVMQRGRVYGYFAVGSGKELQPWERSFLEAVKSLLAHFYQVCEVVAYERTKSAAFEEQQVPALITDQEGRVLEANEALLDFFGYESPEDVQGARLEELFLFHSEETLPQLFRKGHLARPVVAASTNRETELSGVLHSVAGQRVPQGTQLRYFFFLPDGAGLAIMGEKEMPQRHYPRLELPQELSLTAREIDVAIRIAAGESSKEIARRLNVSIRTVQFHRQSLRDKLGIVGRGLSLRHALLKYEQPGS